jgi:UrcA family protein
MNTLRGFILVAATLSCIGTGALAADKEHVVNVSYSDLNTSSEVGSQLLLHRIKIASRRVCGPAPNSSDLYAARLFTACMKDSMGKAVADIHLPLLTMAYEKAEGQHDARLAQDQRDVSPTR